MRRAQLTLAALALAALAPAALARPTPKLVVWITVDQLRGDMPQRFAARFGAGGFRRLTSRGVHYLTAHYQHGSTFTAVGHATLFTGAHPSTHGIVANRWYDRATGRSVSCVEDARHTLLGVKTRRGSGTSPSRLVCATVGDALIGARAGSRVFSISIKDRGAILPAGRRGKAFWYDARSGHFVTSSYYYPTVEALPAWAVAWNAAHPAEAYRGKHWRLLGPRDGYIHAGDDDRRSERPPGRLGRTFPHPLDGARRSSLFGALRYTPHGDALTCDFALAALEHAALGKGPATDLLAISFSATDYIGHAFGPDSLEAEDNVLRLDRTLARLLGAVDRHVGLDRTLVVLSSDHGVEGPHDQDEHDHRPVPGGGAAPPPRGHRRPRQLVPTLDAALRAKFGAQGKLIAGFWSPTLYLDAAAVEALDAPRAEVERALAELAARQPGIARAFTRSDLIAARIPDDPVARKVLLAFHAERSGDVYLVGEPAARSGPGGTSLHGSPWDYDTHVPIVVMGPGIAAARVARRVTPSQLAPSVARILGIRPPRSAADPPLAELITD